MPTELFKTGDRVIVNQEFGGLTEAVYIHEDKQVMNHHMLRLENVLCLQSFHARDFRLYDESYPVFTKKYLKTGMYARTAKGDILTVLLGTKHGDMLVSEQRVIPLSKYTSFLENVDSPKNTIHAVFQPDNSFSYLNTRKPSTAIWHREPEREPMTLSQIEAELGKRIRLIEE